MCCWFKPLCYPVGFPAKRNRNFNENVSVIELSRFIATHVVMVSGPHLSQYNARSG